MRIVTYEGNRGCGKTTAARNLQMEDPENTLLIEVCDGQSKTNISWLLGWFRGRESYSKVIIDEPDNLIDTMRKRDHLIRILLSRGCEELTIFDTVLTNRKGLSKYYQTEKEFLGI